MPARTYLLTYLCIIMQTVTDPALCHGKLVSQQFAAHSGSSHDDESSDLFNHFYYTTQCIQLARSCMHIRSALVFLPGFVSRPGEREKKGHAFRHLRIPPLHTIGIP